MPQLAPSWRRHAAFLCLCCCQVHSLSAFILWCVYVGCVRFFLHTIGIIAYIANVYPSHHMSKKYKFKDNSKTYFVTFTVINWIDLFIRNEYKDILLDSLKFCQQQKRRHRSSDLELNPVSNGNMSLASYCSSMSMHVVWSALGDKMWPSNRKGRCQSLDVIRVWRHGR